MKTPDEIKKGLIDASEEARWVVESGDAHDLIDAVENAHVSMTDALAYIEQLEAALAAKNDMDNRLEDDLK